jgi:hypothetical protein
MWVATRGWDIELIRCREWGGITSNIYGCQRKGQPGGVEILSGMLENVGRVWKIRPGPLRLALFCQGSPGGEGHEGNIQHARETEF